MTPELPIRTLTELARKRTEEAARKLALLRTANMGAGQKLELLLRYRTDYGKRLQALLTAGLPLAQYRNYLDFLQALDEGIAQQRAAAAQAEARLDHGRAEWQRQHQRGNAFETLGERMQRQELVLRSRREQRASDEQAARMLLGRSAPA